MDPELLEWCRRIVILRHVQAEAFPESFCDGVLFHHVLHELFPSMTEELSILSESVSKIVADTDYFGKMDNWKAINRVFLEKLGIQRSDWFLSFIARGKDGYIEDLLNDLKKTSADFGLNQDYDRPGHYNWQTGTYDYENRNGYQDEAGVYNSDEPSYSYYHTPLQTDSQGSRYYNYKHQENRHNGFVNRNNNISSWRRNNGWRNNRGLRQIQRNGHWGYGGGGKYYHRSNFNSYRHKYGNYNRRYGYNRYQNWHQNRQRWTGTGQYSNSTNNHQTSNYSSGIEQQQTSNVNNSYQQEAVNTQQQQQQQQERDAEYLNQRFNDLQYQNNFQLPRPRRTTFSAQFRKYVYRYYYQYPVSCNNCIDNNLQCNCPRFPYSSN